MFYFFLVAVLGAFLGAFALIIAANLALDAACAADGFPAMHHPLLPYVIDMWCIYRAKNDAVSPLRFLALIPTACGPKISNYAAVHFAPRPFCS